MGVIYVDLQVLAEVEDDSYLVTVSKEDLNALVCFNDSLVVRHWDGEKPVELVAYGNAAVRTMEDADETNNLANVPRLRDEDLKKLVNS